MTSRGAAAGARGAAGATGSVCVRGDVGGAAAGAGAGVGVGRAATVPGAPSFSTGAAGIGDGAAGIGDGAAPVTAAPAVSGVPAGGEGCTAPVADTAPAC